MSERPSSAELAWAAGLFEGEGSFIDRMIRDGWSVQAVITMSDRDVLERFCTIIGRGFVEVLNRPNAPAHYRQMYRWRVQDTEGVQCVIKLLLPWLGTRRRAKALEVDAIACTIKPGYVARMDKRTHCLKGHPLTGDNVLYNTRRKDGHRTRRCRECRREYHRDYYHSHKGVSEDA